MLLQYINTTHVKKYILILYYISCVAVLMYETAKNYAVAGRGYTGCVAGLMF